MENPVSEDQGEKLEGSEQANLQEASKTNPVNGSEKRAQLSPGKSKSEGSGGAKPKRKSRSTRRRLNAMISNTSLHFSDTDSEGELMLISTRMRSLSPIKATAVQEGPVNQVNPTISVTSEDVDESVEKNVNFNGLGDRRGSRRGSFIENLTDVDEIYASDPENTESGKDGQGKLKVQDGPCQGETDLEDMSNDEAEEQSLIYVAPRADIFTDFNGETITTKEGDGPFSIEVRNQMSLVVASVAGTEASGTPDILVLPNTDSEDMDASDEEGLEENACGLREVLEDFDVTTASQIVMRNVNKMESLLAVGAVAEDAIGDSHTDIEDVD
ncbi:uncharacterized protein LOC105702572 [Orussus abietinus]|uniref:uncharacterized protein LOC105702572 n=1 Tax=Orussus abietinus TaxID=222816 RepID=UPI0006255216|nr:uncharacterized protein LOC105702572 [Orussus abietinus]